LCFKNCIKTSTNTKNFRTKGKIGNDLKDKNNNVQITIKRRDKSVNKGSQKKLKILGQFAF